MEPTVCVAIATYNHARFLAQAIDSILTQTHPVDEIIVVDDGSTDNPGAVTALYPKVTLIAQKNQGPSAARNTAIKASTSDFILFLDADDRLMPRCVEAGLETLTAAPDCVLAYGGYVMTDAQQHVVGDPCHVPIGENPYVSLLKGNIIGMVATVLFRRDMLLAAGGFDAELRSSEDYELYLRLARLHPMVSYSEVVAEYRWHGGNTSRNDAAQLRWALKVHDRQAEVTNGDAGMTQARLQGRGAIRHHYASRMLRAGGSTLPGVISALIAEPGMTLRGLLADARRRKAGDPGSRGRA